MTRPLFVPLKTQYYEAFANGTKTKEYRYDARWNERTCAIGRPAVLSKGYGRYARLTGRVVSFRRVPPAQLPPDVQADIIAVYGRRGGPISEIGFSNILPQVL